MQKIKLFFTNKQYRRMTFDLFKHKFLFLPGIKQIYLYYLSRKHCKRQENMTSFEKYCDDKAFENSLVSVRLFNGSLNLFLYACDKSQNLEKEFYKLKSEILEYDLIHTTGYVELKEWIEKIDYHDNVDVSALTKLTELQNKILT